jgi:hypothetical protein
MLSKTAAGQLLATHQSLSTKERFAAGWLGCLLTKHSPFFERIAARLLVQVGPLDPTRSARIQGIGLIVQHGALSG